MRFTHSLALFLGVVSAIPAAWAQERGECFIYTTHKVGHFLRNQMKSGPRTDGDWPYIGGLGIGCEQGGTALKLQIDHRSNIDKSGKTGDYEYNYEAIWIVYEKRWRL